MPAEVIEEFRLWLIAQALELSLEGEPSRRVLQEPLGCPCQVEQILDPACVRISGSP